MKDFAALKRVFFSFAFTGLMSAGVGCDPIKSVTPAPPGETLNTGRDILFPATQPTVLGQFPVGLVPSSDGKYAISCGMGYRNALYSVAVADGHLVSKLDFATRLPRQMRPDNGVDDNRTDDPQIKSNGVYYGIAVFGKTVYAAQGAHDSIAVLSLSPDGKLVKTGSIKTQAEDFPAGVAVDARGMLYVANNASMSGDGSFNNPASVAIYDPHGKELGRSTFDSDTHTSNFLLAIAALSNGSKVYTTSERDGVVYVLSTTDPTHPKQSAAIATGSHPVWLMLNRDQSRLYVANALSDTLSVIDTASDRVVGTVLLRPGTSRGLPGVSPTSLAFSPDEKTIYVTLADMNAVGVVDVSSLTLTGMIPVGWYPTGVLCTADHRLLVVNAKGTRARNPNGHPLKDKDPNRDFYILNLLKGDVQSLPIPNPQQLADMTLTVIHDSHLDEPDRQSENPLAGIGLKAGKIKHVIYIIKENRTYDQVLGDDARGNGDPSLTLFGKNVTPNFHALADRFVLLDNCYACGEVSGDGWVWSTQGMANAFVERNIPYHYSNRGRDYDFEGSNNGYLTGGFPALGPDGKPLSKDPAFKNGAPPITDVAATGVHLWDRARQAGVSYRNFGMFLSAESDDGVMPTRYPAVAGLQPAGHDLAGLTDIDMASFDLDYPDSDAPRIYFEQTKDKNCLYRTSAYGKYKSPSRFAEWNREFKQMLAKDPSGNSVPALMLVRLPHDHTQGMSSRRHTPASENADNDYGVAQLVDAVSHSPIWQSSAIFVIEDDAQNGADHVDAHRTTAYVISPWIKRGTVDHRFCNTDTLLKTMELLLGLAPMSQYDAIAQPLMDWDTSPTNIEPYTAVLPPKEVIAQITPTLAFLGSAAPAKDLAALITESDKMDFTHADAAPADRLNQIIWKSVKGSGSQMPAPRYSAVSPILGPLTKPVKDDDDD
jgi:YVTN family beta-propeller protein